MSLQNLLFFRLFQPFGHLCSPLLGLLQQIHVLLVLRCLELETVLLVGVSQEQSRRKASPLWPAGHAPSDAETRILLFIWSIIIYYVELPINRQSWVLLFKASLNPFLDQPVSVFRIAQTQVQDLPFSLFEIPVVPVGRSQASQSLWMASLTFSVSVSLANFPKVYSIPLPMLPIKNVKWHHPNTSTWGTPLISIWTSSHWTQDFKCNHSANSLFTEWSICQTQLSLQFKN